MSKTDICAAVHRLKDKKTIVRVMNRKFSRTAKINSRNLKDSKRYGRNTALYINERLSRIHTSFFLCTEGSFDRQIRLSLEDQIWSYTFSVGGEWSVL